VYAFSNNGYKLIQNTISVGETPTDRGKILLQNAPLRDFKFFNQSGKKFVC